MAVLVSADNVLKLGGKAIGVIPSTLAHKEVARQNLTELHITQSVHERKMPMALLPYPGRYRDT